MFALIDPKCGMPAFMLTEIPEPGYPASSKIALHMNYHPVQNGSIRLCEHCGSFVPLKTANIRTMI
jgi:hypothetical protein